MFPLKICISPWPLTWTYSHCSKILMVLLTGSLKSFSRPVKASSFLLSKSTNMISFFLCHFFLIDIIEQFKEITTSHYSLRAMLIIRLERLTWDTVLRAKRDNLIWKCWVLSEELDSNLWSTQHATKIPHPGNMQVLHCLSLTRKKKYREKPALCWKKISMWPHSLSFWTQWC